MPVPGSHRERSPHFRPDLEGLRGIAVILVLLFHAGVPGVAGGYVGVDVFFVLSGFLITGLLLRELDAKGSISLGAFYGRRVRRLLPAATVVLLVTIVASAVVLPLARIPSISLDVASAAAYISNIRFGIEANDYFAADTAASPVLHFWSLSLEEQFYVFWPAIMLVLWRLRRSRRVALTGIAVLSALSLFAGAWLTEVNAPWAYYLLPTRAWELGVGALLAAAPISGRMPQRIAPWSVLVGLTLIGIATVVFSSATPFPGIAATIPVLGSALVIAGGMSRAPAIPTRLLGVGPLRYMGRISYSAYLWHWPMLVLAGAAFGPLDLSLPVVVLSLGAAALTQRFVEAPFREGFFIGHRPRVNLGQALAASLALIVVCGSATVYARSEIERRLGSLAPQIEVLSDRPTLGWCHDPFVLDPTRCVVGDVSSDRTVVLFGDSTAAPWFGAMEEIAARRGWRLVSLARAGCSWMPVTKLNPNTNRPNEECAAWREDAYTRIAEESPQLVLATGVRFPPYVDGQVITDEEEKLRYQEAGMVDGLQLLAASSDNVVVIGGIPTGGGPPADCITTHIDDVDACIRPINGLGGLSNWEGLVRATAESEGAVYLDLLPWLCTGDTCKTVLDGSIAYRDATHLTHWHATSLAPQLDAFIAQLDPDLSDAATDTAIPRESPSSPASTPSVTEVGSETKLTDTFSRTLELGWGRPDLGPDWIQPPDSRSASSVSDGVGRLVLRAAREVVRADAHVAIRDVEITARWRIQELPTGSTVVLGTYPRITDGHSRYSLLIAVTPAGDVKAWMTARADGSGGPIGPSVRVGTGVVPGEWWRLRVQSYGADPTTLRARVWKEGEAEPATWQLDVTDSTAGLQIEDGQSTTNTVRMFVTTGADQMTLPLSVHFDDVIVSTPSPSPW